MPELTTLPQVLSWLAERWPERCREYPNGPKDRYWLTLGEGLKVDGLNPTRADEAAAEYLIRELIAEAGLDFSVGQNCATPETEYTEGGAARSWAMVNRPTNWGNPRYAEPGNTYLALANAFGEALDE